MIKNHPFPLKKDEGQEAKVEKKMGIRFLTHNELVIAFLKDTYISIIHSTKLVP